MKSQQYQNFYNLSKHFNNYYIDQTMYMNLVKILNQYIKSSEVHNSDQNRNLML